MRNNLVTLGQTIKTLRKEHGLTLSDIAARAGISAALLSKIENFRTVPSLPVLLKIARVLDASLADLVRNVSTHEQKPYHLVRECEAERAERECSSGFEYRALADLGWKHGAFQAFLVTLSPGAQREPVVTDGDEFIFMLQGSMLFQLGEAAISLNRGDSLFFDGRISHVPQNQSGSETLFLVVYLIENAEDSEKNKQRK